MPACNDGVKNGTETAKDCGGSCTACADGAACLVAADCQSGVCGVNKLCSVPSCNDGVKNGTETAVDCGGVCPMCPAVILLGAGAGTAVGAEYSPGGVWSGVSLTGASTDGLALTITGGKGVGVMHLTSGDKLEYATWTPGTWADFQQVGANTTRGRPSIDGASGFAHTVFHGSDFKFYYEAYDVANGTWGSVEQVGSPQNFGAIPGSVVAIASAQAYLFQDGNAGNVFKAVNRSAGTWAGATQVDANANSSLSPTAIALSSGPELLATSIVAASGQILAFTRTAGVWSQTAAVTNAFTNGQVALSPMPNGGAMLAFRGTDGNLYYAVYSAGAWSSVSAFSAPATAIASPPALAHGVGTATAELAFVKADGHAYHARYIANAWTSPLDVGATGLQNVAIASTP